MICTCTMVVTLNIFDQSDCSIGDDHKSLVGLRDDIHVFTYYRMVGNFRGGANFRYFYG